MTRKWRTAHERALAIRSDCDRFCADFRLIEVDERKFGRYLLRGAYSSAEVITVRHGVIVCGDVDMVHFSGFFGRGEFVRAPLYWMASDNYDYAEGKASLGDCLAREFDEDIARGVVLSWRRSRDISRDEARDIFDQIGDNASPDLFYKLVYDTVSGDTAYGLLESKISVTASRVICAQAILCRLVAELEARDVRAKSAQWFGRALSSAALAPGAVP